MPFSRIIFGADSTEGISMRNAVLIAALLTFAAAAPNAALAFDVDAPGNTNPDGSTRYVDPDDNPQFGPTESNSVSSSSSATLGMPFGGGVITGYTGSSDSAGAGDQPWLAPRTRVGH
jgi:hypothetical protein